MGSSLEIQECNWETQGCSWAYLVNTAESLASIAGSLVNTDQSSANNVGNLENIED
jgi:hypothetical protein